MKCVFAVSSRPARSAFNFEHKNPKGKVGTVKLGILQGRHCRLHEKNRKILFSATIERKRAGDEDQREEEA